MIGYLVKEKDSNIAFAVVKDATNKDLVEKVALATKEEFCYESVSPIGELKKSGNLIFQDFNCLLDGDEYEIREIELGLTAIY